MKSQYRIAGITITVDAPTELADNEAYRQYRVYEEREDYRIQLKPDADMPEYGGELLFENELNRIYQKDGELLHLFHIPLTRGVAAWDRLSWENSLTIHVRPGAEAYFRTSIGCFNAAGFERILFYYKKYLFHCAYVAHDQKAVLFSAPSGGGKTTQGLLWERYAGAEMVNGDRAVLEKTPEGYLCHGLPIAGSSGVFLNRTLPLAAVFAVRKASENRVALLSHEEAFQAVFSEITINNWNKEFVLGAVDFALELSRQVPVYRLECRMDEGAVEAALAVL